MSALRSNIMNSYIICLNHMRGVEQLTSITLLFYQKNDMAPNGGSIRFPPVLKGHRPGIAIPGRILFVLEMTLFDTSITSLLGSYSPHGIDKKNVRSLFFLKPLVIGL